MDDTEVIENKRFVYEFGKFVLDPEEKTLFSEGSPVHLPSKEFATLLYLVEHNGRALTKDEMISAIWKDAFVEESNLPKQISRLRKLLNENGQQLIETLPKHGYRFSAELRRAIPQIQEPAIIEKRTVRRVTFAYENDTATAPSPLALSAAPPSRLFTSSRLAVVSVAALVLLAAGWYWMDRTRGGGKINSIAVLPLRSLGSDEDGKALGLGLADALITKLGSTRQVVVRPTSAVARIAGDTDPIETGRNLNVDAVLEGTIQQADGKLRVNARLLRTSSGEQIWSETFDEESGRIFALQDALSTKIAKTLSFELSKADRDKMLRRGTENAEAYEKYLRGRYYQSQNTPDGLARSLEFYEQAIALDAAFAEAYAGIADSNCILFNFGLRTEAETMPKAREAVDRALKLDPDMPSAYASLAFIQFLSDGDWADAEKSLQHALSLDPNSADAYLRYGYFLINVGRFDESLEKLNRARELNPLSPIVQADIGLAYLCGRRYPEAIVQLEKVAADNPRFSIAHWFLGSAYEAAGDPNKALASNLRAMQIEGETELAERIGKAVETGGVDAANRLWFEETVAQRKTGAATSLEVAQRAATIADREQTLYWLERAVKERDSTLAGVKYLAKYDFVRGDPRFLALEKDLSR
jgi:DNA-binding winged helix-turn-helix (wHTH) protein/TolB-like protein